MKTASIGGTGTGLVGEKITYTFTATNTGNVTLTNVSVSDPLVGLSAITPSSVATMAPGAVETFTATYTITQANVNAGSVTNQATATGTPPSGPAVTDLSGTAIDNNNPTVTPLPVSDLGITKTVNNGSAAVGSQVIFTITVTNAGPSTSATTSVADLLPNGYTYVSSTVSQGSYVSGTGAWTIGSMISGATATLTLTATVNASGTYLNTATVTTSSTDPNPDNNTASAEVTPNAVADLNISKSVDNPTPLVGQNVTFTITVTNTGPNSATAVVVADALPSGYTFVSSTVTVGSFGSVNGVWNIGALATGASATLTIIANVNPTGDYLNIAVVSSPTDDPNTDNNTASASVNPRPVSNLGITKTVNNPNPTAGSQVVFTITVTNAGPSVSATTTVTDALPTGYTFVSGTTTQGSYSNTTGVWNIGSMNSGATATLTVTVTVNAEGEYLNVAVVQTDSVDPNPNNNRAEASIQLETDEIEANDNDLTNEPIDFNVGGDELVNVLSNDFINGQPATIDKVIITILQPAAHPGVVLDVKTGFVSVAPEVPSDIYTITYKICLINKPQVCDDAKVMLNIINNTLLLTTTIEGNIWYDYTEDGVWRDRERFKLSESQQDERALHNWKVYLEGKNIRGNALFLSTSTRADGSYSFEKVPEGEFKVYREFRNTWIPAFPLVLNDNPTGQYHIVKVNAKHGSIASEKRRIVAGNSKGWMNKLPAGTDTLYIGAYLDLDTTLDGTSDTRVFVSGPVVMSWNAEKDQKVEYIFRDFELLGDSKKLGRVALKPLSQGTSQIKGKLSSGQSDSLATSSLEFPFELRIGNATWVVPANQTPLLSGFVSQMLPYNQKHVSTNTTALDLRLSGGDVQARLIHMEWMPLYGVDFSNNQSVFGTAPGAKYPVIMEDDGARHILPFAEKFRNQFIGDGFTEIQTIVRNRTNVHLQIDEQQTIENTGVEFLTDIKASQEVVVIAKSNASGFIHGWIDYNRDGKWSADEKVASSVLIAKGVNEIRFIVPDGVRSGETWTRWRFCDCPGELTSTGIINGGEIEDYPIQVSSTGGSISGVMWYDKNADGILGDDEQRLEGLNVWVDLNSNGLQDPMEPSAKTDSNGAYVIESVPDGTVRVKPEIKTSWVLTNIAGVSYATVIVKELEKTQNVNFGFMALSTSDHVDASLPTEFALWQNYPNPFNPTTVIPFDLAQSGKVRIAIYDVTGRLVKTLVDQYMTAGKQTVALDASTMPSGVYIVRMDAGGQRFTSKLTLIK